jgi:hypothetical protein
MSLKSVDYISLLEGTLHSLGSKGTATGADLSLAIWQMYQERVKTPPGKTMDC